MFLAVKDQKRPADANLTAGIMEQKREWWDAVGKNGVNSVAQHLECTLTLLIENIIFRHIINKNLNISLAAKVCKKLGISSFFFIQKQDRYVSS